MIRLIPILIYQLTRVVHLLLSPKVPFKLKLIPVFALAYVIFPHDFLKDFIPIVGWIDDFWIFSLAMGGFIMLSKPHLSKIPGQSEKIIQPDYEVLDTDEDENKTPQ